jgi:hypothetical protein
MKKLLLTTFLVIGSLTYSETKNLPDNVDRAIRGAVSTYSGSDRRDNYDWYKDSYFEMMERLDKSGIPNTDKEVIVKRLTSMYGANYPKQLSRVNDEIADYQNLVARIKEEQLVVQQKIENENKKSKEEIENIVSESGIAQKELEKIQEYARTEYPNDYTSQKAYIQGAIRIYKELKK